LPEALEDVSRLRSFLEDKSPIATKRAGMVLLEAANLLATHPEIGQPMNDGTDRRQLFQPFGAVSYVLRYIFEDQTVFIIRVWHGKEKREDH
jgi:plasmid stabilization system protein ParE